VEGTKKKQAPRGGNQQDQEKKPLSDAFNSGVLGEDVLGKTGGSLTKKTSFGEER